MDVRFPGFIDNIFLNNIQDMLDQFTDEASDTTKQQTNIPSRVYVRDTKAMARTPADIKDIPNAYQYIVDMPGVKPSEVKVQIEDENVLVVSGERRRDKEKDEKEGVKYVKMERRLGKFMRKFVLPENANIEKISAACQDGVLIVTVEKVPPPKPMFPKTIEVKGA